MSKKCNNPYCKECYPNNSVEILDAYDKENIMSLHATHPDDLEVLADEHEEMLLLQKHSFDDIVDVLDEEPMKLVLFKEDGEYGWSTFAGVFDCLERIIDFASKDGRDVVVGEADEHGIPDNPHIDFVLIDCASNPIEELFGVMLVPENAFVNV